MAQRDVHIEHQLFQLEQMVKSTLKPVMKQLDCELDRYSPERADASDADAPAIYATVMHDVHVRVARACAMLISKEKAGDYTARERQEWSASALESAAQHPNVTELPIQDPALIQAIDAVSALLQSTAAVIRRTPALVES